MTMQMPIDQLYPDQDASPVTGLAARSPVHSPEVVALGDWLVEQGLLRASFGTIIKGFCESLVAIGVPLWRGFATIRLLHPTIGGVGCSWRPQESIRTEPFVYRMTPSEDFLKSPFRYMLDEGISSLRLCLETTEPVEFPLIERFRQEGATDYLAEIVGFGVDGVADGKSGVTTSWTTARSGGFTEDQVAILRHLIRRLALALQARLGHDTAVNLLKTYVGPEASGRILDGEIRRGSLQVISAVIFYADLRGFTAMADRLGRDELVDMLNAYFDCMVPVLVERGGYVLKFLGDGLLATFPLEDHAAAAACERSLDAAGEALRCVRDLNVERAAAGKPVMDARRRPAPRRRALRQRRQCRSARLHGDRAGGQRGCADRGALQPARAQPFDFRDLCQGGHGLGRAAGLDRPLRASGRAQHPVPLYARRPLIGLRR